MDLRLLSSLLTRRALWKPGTIGASNRSQPTKGGRRQFCAAMAGLTRPLKVAVVSSRLPTHPSAVVGASLTSRLVPTLRLDATAPRAETVAALNGFQPRLLVGCASALRPLAAEQQPGRLAIRPRIVGSASEVLSLVAAKEMEEAWGAAPFAAAADLRPRRRGAPNGCHRVHRCWPPPRNRRGHRRRRRRGRADDHRVRDRHDRRHPADSHRRAQTPALSRTLPGLPLSVLLIKDRRAERASAENARSAGDRVAVDA